MTLTRSLPDQQLELIVGDYLAEIEWAIARRLARSMRGCQPEHGWKRMQGWAEHQLLRMRVEQESAEALLMVFQARLPVPDPAQRAAQAWKFPLEVLP
jgi:hypothetical protein